MNPSFDYSTFKHELPLIFRELGSGTRKIMESYLKKQGVNSLKRIELMSNEAVKQAVMAGLGYSIMPLIGIKREIKQGLLEVIPRPGLPITTDWKLIWHKEKKPSPVAKAFMTFVLENNERIKQSFFN
jgi:DNA-binding transcriptional LysR family regulator